MTEYIPIGQNHCRAVMICFIKLSCKESLLSLIFSMIGGGLVPRGPFLESPENFSGPKSHS